MATDPATMLREWAEHYLRNKDLLTRSIQEVQRGSQGWDIVLQTTTGPRYVLALPDLADVAKHVERIGDNTVYVFTTNTRKNVDALVSAWDSLIGSKKLTVLFVNPDSSTDKRWALMPHVHERVSERAALRLGLGSLFATVDEFRD